MSKVDTDQGLGPGSERRRREMAGEKDDAPPSSDSKKAETDPGIGKVERRTDTLDDLLGGFGPSRPDLPRILPAADTTPPPEPIRRELTPTQPGKRQRLRNMILVGAITFGVIVLLGIVLVKMNATTTSPTESHTPSTTQTQTVTATPLSTETIAPITTLSVEALPTVAKTVVTTPATARTVHSATTASTAPATTTTTVTTAHPTGSAPPGMNLLPDDPHR